MKPNNNLKLLRINTDQSIICDSTKEKSRKIKIFTTKTWKYYSVHNEDMSHIYGLSHISNTGYIL